MQHLEVSCAVRRFFKSLGFKGIRQIKLIQGDVINSKYTINEYVHNVLDRT